MATVYQQLDPSGARFLAANFPAVVQNNGTSFPVSGLAFDAAAVTAEAAFFMFRAVSYGSGNVTIDLDWYADTASTNAVVWGAQLGAITPNTDSQDVETKALATTQTTTTTHLGTTGQRVHRSSITVSTNLDSLAANDDVWLRIYRDSNNGSDTMTGDAILIGVTVSYSDT